MSQMSGLPTPDTPTRSSFLMMSKKRQDDRWALAYINAAYVQPILEAVDDDGTGFVSIKEVNTFVAERPENWTYVITIRSTQVDGLNSFFQFTPLDCLLGCRFVLLPSSRTYIFIAHVY